MNWFVFDLQGVVELLLEDIEVSSDQAREKENFALLLGKDIGCAQYTCS